MATLRSQYGINVLFLFIVHLSNGITMSLQTFSEEQFLLELSDDRHTEVTRPLTRGRPPPYLGDLYLGFQQLHHHHHQPEVSENDIYDSDESNLLRTPLDRGPHFDLSASKNVTALVGKTAYLNCRVKNIGNKTVSWVRHRDIHLLTVGRFSYTSDQRFQAVHNPQTDDWSLQIRYPQKRDTGVYECQISTTPPVGHSMFLSVVEPITTIIGVPDLYIDTGSTVNLTCIVRNSPEPPSSIVWTHNNQQINYNSPRGGVSIITEKGETSTSYLLMQHAQKTDNGKYICSPSNADPSTINVHILDGTFGLLPSFMEAAFNNTSHTEWHRSYTSVSRSEMILTAAKTIATLYKHAVLEYEQTVASQTDSPEANSATGTGGDGVPEPAE